MIANARSTLAQMLFPAGTAVDLAAVVEDLDKSLAPCLGLGHRLSWHGGTTAILELGATRVVLGLAALHGAGRVHDRCLSVSVGAVPGLSSDLAPGRRHEDLAHSVVETVQGRHRSDTVIWQQVPEGMTPDRIAELAAAIPAVPDPVWTIHRPRAVPPSARAVPVTADQSLLHRARSAIYPEPIVADVPDQPSMQMRVAATAMASTVAIVALPVGAALITYSLFRGADIRLSGHVMALTGTFIALGQSPAGQTFLASLG